MPIYIVIFIILGVVLGLMAPRNVIPWVIGFVTAALIVLHFMLALMACITLSTGTFFGLWLRSGLANKSNSDKRNED